jgi:hypothetical protein
MHCNPDASVCTMNRFRRMVTVGHNAGVFVWNRRPTKREETAKHRSEGDMQLDAWYWRWARWNPPPGCLWWLWRSASTLTQPVRPDGNVFCWCRHLSEFACDSRVGSVTLPGAPKVLSSTPTFSKTYLNHSHGTPLNIIRYPSYSQGRPECPPRVWYSPESDASNFTIHILSDTPRGFQWLKYILLMRLSDVRVSIPWLPACSQRSQIHWYQQSQFHPYLRCQIYCYQLAPSEARSTTFIILSAQPDCQRSGSEHVRAVRQIRSGVGKWVCQSCITEQISGESDLVRVGVGASLSELWEWAYCNHQSHSVH